MRLKHSKISPYKVVRIIKCFCLDLTAQQCSELLNINRNTVNRYYLIFRKAIYKHQQSKQESSFAKQNFGQSISQKSQPEFPKKEEKKVWKKWYVCVLKIENHIYTRLIKDKILSELRHDMFFLEYDYEAVINISQNKLIRINKNKPGSDKQPPKPEEVERFWGFSKQRLNKFNGVNNYFDLHLKECEWRWKKAVLNLEKELKKLILTGLSYLILNNYFFESNLAQIL